MTFRGSKAEYELPEIPQSWEVFHVILGWNKLLFFIYNGDDDLLNTNTTYMFRFLDVDHVILDND